MSSALRHQQIHTNGVDLHVVTAGPSDGPMVLLLHGFPEGGHAWNRQIGPLADQGYHVVVPDQRGYGASSRPRAVSAYRTDLLVLDALGLIDQLGGGAAHVIGHDWGGILGWWLALEHPEHVRSFAVLNAPHPRVMRRALLTPQQLSRSWYALAFQVPGLPERILSRDRAEWLVVALQAGSVLEKYTPDEIEAYRSMWLQPGALSAMLSWYRAAARWPRLPLHRRVRVPTVVIWGCRDPALGFELVGPSVARCDDARLVVLRDAGHSVQHDAAERVNPVLAEHLASGAGQVRRTG